jgi:hypothetical protein
VSQTHKQTKKHQERVNFKLRESSPCGIGHQLIDFGIGKILKGFGGLDFIGPATSLGLRPDCKMDRGRVMLIAEHRRCRVGQVGCRKESRGRGLRQEPHWDILFKWPYLLLRKLSRNPKRSIPFSISWLKSSNESDGPPGVQICELFGKSLLMSAMRRALWINLFSNHILVWRILLLECKSC